MTSRLHKLLFFFGRGTLIIPKEQVSFPREAFQKGPSNLGNLLVVANTHRNLNKRKGEAFLPTYVLQKYIHI